MSFHEPARDVKRLRNVTSARPFKQRGKDGLLAWLQPIHQQAEDIVRVDLGHNAVVELETVPPIVAILTVIRERCLRSPTLGRIEAAPGGSEVLEMEFSA